VHAECAAALAALPAVQPQAVLLDIALSHYQDIECLRLLKKQLPNSPLMIITPCEDPQTVLRSIKAGASGYLLKPIEQHLLLTALHELFQGGAPVTSRINRILIQSLQSADSADRKIPPLSPRQSQMLGLLAQGLLYKEIAELLHIRVATVNAHARRIYEKLRVRSRGQAVAQYLQLREHEGVL
jgi:DNA-binding NarL/FixJ family response regulator